MEDGCLTARQLTEAGTVSWRMSLPAALTLCEWSYALRLPTFSGLRRAKTAQIERLSPGQLGLSPEECGLKGSPTRVVNVSVRESGVRQTAWLTKDAACDRLGELLREVKA